MCGGLTSGSTNLLAYLSQGSAQFVASDELHGRLHGVRCGEAMHIMHLLVGVPPFCCLRLPQTATHGALFLGHYLTCRRLARQQIQQVYTHICKSLTLGLPLKHLQDALIPDGSRTCLLGHSKPVSLTSQQNQVAHGVFHIQLPPPTNIL